MVALHGRLISFLTDKKDTVQRQIRSGGRAVGQAGRQAGRQADCNINDIEDNDDTSMDYFANASVAFFVSFVSQAGSSLGDGGGGGGRRRRRKSVRPKAASKRKLAFPFH